MTASTTIFFAATGAAHLTPLFSASFCRRSSGASSLCSRLRSSRLVPPTVSDGSSIGLISGEAVVGWMSGLRKTACASRNGLSNPTVMTRKGSASERETGSIGTFKR